MVSTRDLLVLALLVPVLLSAPTGARAEPGAIPQELMRLRAGAGLAAVPELPETARAAAAALSRSRPVFSQEPAVAADISIFVPGTDPDSLLQDAGTLALVLDPRLVGLSAAEGADGTIALATLRDLSQPFPTGRLVVSPRRWDPSSSHPLVVVGAAQDSIGPLELRDRRGMLLSPLSSSTQQSAGTQVTIIRGGHGAEIPFARTVSVLAPSGAATFRTSPAPKGRPLRVSGLPRRIRQRLRTALAGTPPLLARRILPAVVGRVTVVGPRPSLCGGPQVSCFSDDGRRRILSLARSATDGSPEGRFVILHEFGHLVSDVGLTDADMAAFSRMLRASRAHRCLPDPLQIDLGRRTCVSDEEWFADEFARWAVGDRRATSGYRTRSALGPAVMARFLRSRFALHP